MKKIISIVLATVVLSSLCSISINAAATGIDKANKKNCKLIC